MEKEKIFTSEFLKEIGFTLIDESKSKFKPYSIYGKAKDNFSLTLIEWCEEGHSVTYFGEQLKPNTSVGIKKDAVNAMTSVFEANPTIDKIELASFGTYYKYELAGETHYNTDCLNKHIDKDLFNNICELYDFYLPSEEDLEVTFGWPERGFQVFGVRRKPKSKKLEAYVEDYDGVE